MTVMQTKHSVMCETGHVETETVLSSFYKYKWSHFLVRIERIEIERILMILMNFDKTSICIYIFFTINRLMSHWCSEQLSSMC